MFTQSPRSPGVDENEASRQRRAVYRALSVYLQGEELVRALWLWHDRRGRDTSFELMEYVSLVTARTQRRAARNAMYLSLVRAMATPLDQLGPDPWRLMHMQKHRETDPVVASTDTSATEVFEQLLEQFFSSLNKNNAIAAGKLRAWLHERLGTRLDQLEINAATAAHIVRWLNGTAPHIGLQLSKTVMHRLVQAVYILACETIGPVPTDAALANAVRTAERHPAAFAFSPRELL